MNQSKDLVEIGNAFFLQGKFDEALRNYRKALCIDKNSAIAYYNIANILARRSKFTVAEKHYKEALRIIDNWPEALNNLGNVLKEQGKNSEAMDCYIKAISLKPEMAEAYNGLANLYQSEGMIKEAINLYNSALKINPHYTEADSNRLLALNYSDDYSPEEIFKEHLSFARHFQGDTFSTGFKSLSDKKTKIGYVSPDFRRHSVGYFISPLLENHNHQDFQVYCYSDVPVPDAITEKLRTYADHWIDSCNWDDLTLWKRIKEDRIDILIDLAGHSGYNRLKVFARRAAPYQITWLGYPNTTGLKAMDYRIVDNFTDPVGLTDGFYTEKLIRMRGCFLCFQPPTDAPEIEPPPVKRTGYITFGSLNNLSKLNDFTLDLWADILKTKKDSMLLIKSRALIDPYAKERIVNRFKERGIEAKRLQLLGFVKGFKEHLSIYNSIDIALDTFPYNGTTTTFEALFMGVPVVSLSGKTHASRVGLSILSNMGLSDLAVSDRNHYLTVALNLASDIQALTSFKSSLRNKLLQSILCHKRSFTKEFELILNNLRLSHISCTATSKEL